MNHSDLDSNWDVWVHSHIPSHRRYLGAPVQLAKRLALWVLGPHDRELLRRQREFNAAARKHLKELAARVAELEQKLGTGETAAYPRTVRHRYNGVELTLSLPDAHAASWYDADWPRMPELEFLRERRMKPGSTVFDIGAHHGIYALLFADAVGTGGKVLAVEANAGNVRAAQKNRELNGALQIEVVHAAGSDAPGTLRFGRGSNGQVDPRGVFDDSVEVRATSVDELALQHGGPDVLFIDVEGFECKVLEGARQTLADGSPDVFIEVHRNCGLEDFGGSVAALLALLPSRYSLYCCSERERDVRPFKRRGDPIADDRFFLIACV
jgi:FkbM family methyltransferase